MRLQLVPFFTTAIAAPPTTPPTAPIPNLNAPPTAETAETAPASFPERFGVGAAGFLGLASICWTLLLSPESPIN